MNTLQKGDESPKFKALNQDGNPISSEDYKGKKYIIFFYPKASTQGCTAEACNLRDNLNHLQTKGFEIIGISADSVKKQKKFHVDNNLNYPLIADENKEIINAFGVWGEKKFMGKVYQGIHRFTFIINENGIIDEVITKVKTKDHANQIL